MRRDQLTNGNPLGDLSSAPQCGAKTREGALRDKPSPEMAKASKSLNLLAFKMVGVTGIEPVTPTMST